ncbi:MAG: phosphoribosylglycinamide formyltransferase [Alphaproteobacteria bacterium]
MERLKVGVLISGRGSNLQALIAACAKLGYPAELALVVSNVPGAAGLAHARSAGIPSQVVDHRSFATRIEFEAELDRVFTKAAVRLVCLAGFMRLLNDPFVTTWRDRMINIHPSLLPAFPGLNTHERVLQSGVRFSGATVHFLRPQMDIGPIIVQAAVPVLPDDDAASLAERVLGAEHRIYPLAVRFIAENRVRVHGDVVLIDGAKAPTGVVLNPTESG